MAINKARGRKAQPAKRSAGPPKPRAQKEKAGLTASKDDSANKSGRKRKVFSESLGMEHLIKLSNEISASHAEKLKSRVDKAKETQAWKKNRRKAKVEGELSDGGTDDEAEESEHRRPVEDGSGQAKAGAAKKAQLLSKSSIRAGLVAKQREKTRIRKEARKAAAKQQKEEDAAAESLASSRAADSQRKRVSFA